MIISFIGLIIFAVSAYKLWGLWGIGLAVGLNFVLLPFANRTEDEPPMDEEVQP